MLIQLRNYLVVVSIFACSITFGSNKNPYNVLDLYLSQNTMMASGEESTPSAPAIPGTISGDAKPCPNSSVTYSVSPVSGATGYSWSLPSGVSTISGSSNSYSITLIVGSSGLSGTIKVRSYNSAGTRGYNSGKTISAPQLSAQLVEGTYLSGNTMSGGVECEVTQSASTLLLNISSNGSWNVYETPSWISNPYGSSGTGSFYQARFSFDKYVNSTATPRTDYVRIKETQCNKTVDVKITQLAHKVDPEPISGYLATNTISGGNECYITQNSGGITVKLNNTTDVEIVETEDWISHYNGSPIVTTTNASVIFGFGKNTDPTKDRVGTVTFKSGNWSEILEFQQKRALPSMPHQITGLEYVVKGTPAVTYTCAAMEGADSYYWVVPTGMIIQSGQNTSQIVVSVGPLGVTDGSEIQVRSKNSSGSSGNKTFKVYNASLTAYPKTPYYKAREGETYVYAPEQNTLVLNVSSNVTYAVTDNVSWITCQSSSRGPGNYDLAFSLTQNGSVPTSRSGYIILTYENYEEIIYVKQEGVEVNISPVASTYLSQNTHADGNEQFFIDKNGGVFSMSVDANTDWQVSILPDWISYGAIGSGGEGISTVDFTYDYNKNIADYREGTINYTSLNTTYTVHLKQEPYNVTAIPVAGTYLSKNTLSNGNEKVTVSHTGGTFQVEINSEVTGNISNTGSDVTTWPTTFAQGFNTYNFTLPPNTDGNNDKWRMISLTRDNWVQYFEVIQQEAPPTLNIGTISNTKVVEQGIEYYEVPISSGQIIIPIVSNTNWTITKPDWLITTESLTGDGNKTITFTYESALLPFPEQWSHIQVQAENLIETIYVHKPEEYIRGSLKQGTYETVRQSNDTTYYTVDYATSELKFLFESNIPSNYQVYRNSQTDYIGGESPRTEDGQTYIGIPLTVNSGVGRPVYIYIKDNNNSTIAILAVTQEAVKELTVNSPMNYVVTTTYRENEIVSSQGIQYYDKLGKSTQTLARSLEHNKLLATETIYDELGRPIISTLPGAVTAETFNYVDDFTNSNTFDHLDPYGYTAQLNKYYSAENVEDKAIAHDRQPYSEVFYSDYVPGAVSQSYMAGDNINNNNKYTTGFTVHASPDELHDLTIHNYLDIRTLQTAAEGLSTRADYEGYTKSVGIDAMGKESVTYYDVNGNVVASCMTGKGSTRDYLVSNTLQTENETGYVDIHLPNDGNGNYTLTKNYDWNSQLIDLVTNDSIINWTRSNLNNVPPGIYRIRCEEDLPITTEPTINFNMRYKNHSFSAYDEVGRLTRTISPQHVQEILNGNLPAADIDMYITRNTYNIHGQLTETYSPDEDTTRFKYRRDGKVRFSQNAVQKESGKYSYTNYDKHGRVVEVGEFNGNAGGLPFENTDSHLEKHYKVGDGINSRPDLCSDVILTVYGSALKQTAPNGEICKYTRGKVVKTYNSNDTTWYSYNYDGTVSWIAQQIKDLDLNNDGLTNEQDLVTIHYTYDFSGNATEVVYRKGFQDEFTHYYEHDLDNRLEAVYTNARYTTTPVEEIPGLIGYWTLNNDADDQSKNANHGTAENEATLIPGGKIGGAYTLDGVNDHIRLRQDYNFESTQAWTISLWIDWTGNSIEEWSTFLLGNKDNTNDYIIIKRNYNYYFGIMNSNGVRYILPDNSSSSSLYNSGWKLLTIVADGAGHLTFYIDNEPGQTLDADTKFSFNSLGQGFSEDRYNLNGSIDDVRLFNRALSATEINDIFIQESEIQLNAPVIESTDKTLQAKYEYYQHGPLKRVVLGDNLQGIDYTYNINGLLKAINNPAGDDPGGDAYDAFAMALDYYNGDYNNNNFNFGNSTTANNYDGNIHQQRYQNKKLNTEAGLAVETQNAWQYTYDERNYLATATYGTATSTGAFTADVTGAYNVFGTAVGTPINYDANGNILNLGRNNGQGQIMDQFTYNYTRSIPALNRLTHVSDAVLVDTLGDLGNQNAGNYTYNTIGQLTEDKYGKDGAGHKFTYDVYGKVTEVKDNANGLIAEYKYNERGFRIKKKDYLSNKTTWYARDASGNILATYETTNGATSLTEVPVYGSGRVGLANASNGLISNYTYELTDHLGNVRATFTEDGDDPDFEADVLYAADYYPFGMTMPGREFKSKDYRFGYQGQFAEKDEETGYNQFEARLYDNRIGRWLVPDPAKQFHSPYLGMGNSPIMGVDPDGRSVWSTKYKGIYYVTIQDRGTDHMEVYMDIVFGWTTIAHFAVGDRRLGDKDFPGAIEFANNVASVYSTVKGLSFLGKGFTGASILIFAVDLYNFRMTPDEQWVFEYAFDHLFDLKWPISDTRITAKSREALKYKYFKAEEFVLNALREGLVTVHHDEEFKIVNVNSTPEVRDMVKRLINDMDLLEEALIEQSENK